MKTSLARLLIPILAGLLLPFAQACAQEARPGPGEHRIALVVGNANYKESPLRNPVNDARAMAIALEHSGFKVMLRENVTQREFLQAIRLFSQEIKPTSVALFYFAGHGVQLRDRNFLIATDADIQSEDDIPYSSIDLGQVLDRMDRAKSRMNLVILDACRNNPFARAWRSASQGLAAVEAPTGTLIAYATSPGKVASDGDGENGLYTSHLLRQFRVPGVPVEIAFKRVRESVSLASGNQQIPWESSSLKGDFYFVPTAANANAPVSTADQQARESERALAVELAFWDSVKTSQSVGDYRAYLSEYPTGRFASLARTRVSSLLAAASPKVDVAPQVIPDGTSSKPPNTPPSTGRPAGTSVASVRISSQPTALPKGTLVAALLPSVGERWIYRVASTYSGQGSPPKMPERIEFQVNAVTGAGISESARALDSGHDIGSIQIGTDLGFFPRPTIPLLGSDFSPFAPAFRELKPGTSLGTRERLVHEQSEKILLSGRVEGVEDVRTPAGAFRAVKVTWRGRLDFVHGGGFFAGHTQINELHEAWYSEGEKRFVRYAYATQVHGSGPTALTYAVSTVLELEQR